MRRQEKKKCSAADWIFICAAVDFSFALIFPKNVLQKAQKPARIQEIGTNSSAKDIRQSYNYGRT